jgi:putative spermidine/putrescine transport system permease protein
VVWSERSSEHPSDTRQISESSNGGRYPWFPRTSQGLTHVRSERLTALAGESSDMKFTPYWLDTAPQGPDRSGTQIGGRVDVAIIGAGLTGLSAALHLARKGANVELRKTLAGRIALTAIATVILLFLALPIVVILVTSFSNNAFAAFPPEAWTLNWYKALFADGSKWPAALTLSAFVACLSTLFSLIIGVTAATALTRSELPLRSAVYALVLGPLLIPQIVTALGLFLLFEPAAMLGSPIAIALGHTVLASPIAVLILIATLRGIDERLEAAASMGAGRLTIARRITFPLAAPGMIAAAIFSFITSFDEFYISQFLSSVDTVTLPVQIYNSLTFDIDPSVTAISAILIAFAILALALVALVRWLGSGRQGSLLSVENTAGITTPGGETV